MLNFLKQSQTDMEITITYDDFKNLRPMTITQSEDVFKSLAMFIDIARQELHRYVGSLADIESPSIETLCKRYILCKAFHIAIPSLDLVLTPTGFGVVSNNTLAPASRERVDSLSSQVKAMSLSILSDIRDTLHTVESWVEAGNSGNAAICLVKDLRRYISEEADSLVDNQERFIQARHLLVKVLGVEQTESFIQLSARALVQNLTPSDRLIIRAMQDVEGAVLVEKDPHNAMLNLDRLIEQYAELYPAYTASPQYRAKHMQRYTSRPTDGAYFI